MHSKNIPAKLDTLKSPLAVFNGKKEDDRLSADEIEEIQGITNEIPSLSRVNTSISCQQSRLLWLKDSDANSKYFHSVLSNRRRCNSIVSLMVNGNLMEWVHPIHNVVFSHFRSHFEAQTMFRPGIENLAFKTLSYVEGSGLIKLFSIDDVKTTLWDCDSFKSPKPDGVNFGFI